MHLSNVKSSELHYFHRFALTLSVAADLSVAPRGISTSCRSAAMTLVKNSFLEALNCEIMIQEHCFKIL